MTWLFESSEAVQAFLETGGSVLYLIGGITFWMWTLILERFWFFSRASRAEIAAVEQRWQDRPDQTSWYAKQVRRMMISEIDLSHRQSLGLIKSLVALCPLLGLLGTVTGMIEVFDVMAIAGSGNARAMAAGVAKATIPTMAGMVAALSGLYFSARLGRHALQRTERVADHLTHV